MRPRIRTIKPELWQDERVGKLSRDARLLLVALVTMADDEGRIRALPAAIIGHAYAYDRDAPRKLPAWIAEIVASGQIVEYEDSGVPYLAFRHWKRHQRINRATASTLPAPPDHRIVVDNAVKPHDSFSEDSVNAHRGIGADRSGSENGSSNASEGSSLEAAGSSHLRAVAGEATG